MRHFPLPPQRGPPCVSWDRSNCRYVIYLYYKPLNHSSERTVPSLGAPPLCTEPTIKWHRKPTTYLQWKTLDVYPRNRKCLACQIKFYNDILYPIDHWSHPGYSSHLSGVLWWFLTKTGPHTHQIHRSPQKALVIPFSTYFHWETQCNSTFEDL